jgi:hypothetical protein
MRATGMIKKAQMNNEWALAIIILQICATWTTSNICMTTTWRRGQRKRHCQRIQRISVSVGARFLCWCVDLRVLGLMPNTNTTSVGCVLHHLYHQAPVQPPTVYSRISQRNGSAQRRRKKRRWKLWGW